MKNDGRKLSTEKQHLIRKLAVQRVLDGESAADVLVLVKRKFLPGLEPREKKEWHHFAPKLEQVEIVAYQNLKNRKLNAGL